MHIAFVTLGFAPWRSSGLDVSGERLVRELIKAGHRVTVIAGTPQPISETWTHPALSIHRVHVGVTNWIGFAFAAARLLNTLRPSQSFDIVHFWDVHFAYAYRRDYVASLQHSFRQRWGVWEQDQGKPLAKLFRFGYYSLARILAEIPSTQRARGLLAGSDATRSEFIEHYGIAPERIALARHGIDTQFFRPVPTDALRFQLGLATNEPVILFVGFVTPRKGLEYLAHALPRMVPAPRLLIVGRWSQTYRSRFFGSLGPAAGQVIDCGFVPDEQMPGYYSLADVYVSPSLLEGFGLPLGEALACETPVVCVNAGASAEVVGPGGTLVPAKDPLALAEATSRLLSNAPLRRQLGCRGREHVIREFNIEQTLRATCDAYERFRRPARD